ncbi:DUF2975 domain-containing protein [Flavonifractor hominis]|uniref:DUF2975 domain-containing protein n=1 Tax=Flavonifractor hominis TaxID=3133178 RepID=A0ABV1ENJ3_9FIRM
MERTGVQKLAAVLRVLVSITFVCNLVVLPLVPHLVRPYYVEDWLYQELLWDLSLVWQDIRAVVLMLFLWFCGVCTAVVLWQARRVLSTILEGKPFQKANSTSLRRSAVCSFLIAAAALVRLVWGLAYYGTIEPLLSYNALFVPVFFMGGLLCLVMSALFRQAAELKAENDLTI